MSERKTRVCRARWAGGLDNFVRRWLQNPGRILGPYVREGMTVLDVGCGPGFFSVELARRVGKSGRLIACDLQEGMLQRLREKIRGTDLESRVTLHRCEADRLGVTEKVDFVLAFYMAHEVPNQDGFLAEIASLLKPDGRVFLVEPPIHVSRRAFEETLRKAERAGLSVAERPRMWISRAALLKRADGR